MKTLKIIGIAAVVLAVGAGVWAIAATEQEDAQGAPWMGLHKFFSSRFDIPGMIMGQLKERLNLTDEQEAQIRPILEEKMQQRMSMFGKFRGQMHQGWQAAGTEREAIWQETEQQLAEILTPEQMEELRKLKEEFPGRWHHASPGGKSGMFAMHEEVQQLLADLNLTDEQKNQLLDIFLKYRDNRGTAVDTFFGTHAKFTNQILTQEFNEEQVRQLFRESTAQFEDFVVNRAKMLSEMKAVLTAEQVTLLQQKVPKLVDSVHERIQQGRGMMDTLLKYQKK